MNGQKASTSYDRQVWHCKEFLFLAQFPKEMWFIQSYYVQILCICHLRYYHHSA